MTPSIELENASVDHLNDCASNDLVGLKGSDGTTTSDRILRHGKWHTKMGENISFGKDQIRDIVISWLIDDNVASKGNRRNLLHPGKTTYCYTSTTTLLILFTFINTIDLLYVGAAMGAHNKHKVCCICTFAHHVIPHEGIENIPPQQTVPEPSDDMTKPVAEPEPEPELKSEPEPESKPEPEPESKPEPEPESKPEPEPEPESTPMIASEEPKPSTELATPTNTVEEEVTTTSEQSSSQRTEEQGKKWGIVSYLMRPFSSRQQPVVTNSTETN
jgi:hypothetical protein